MIQNKLKRFHLRITITLLIICLHDKYTPCRWNVSSSNWISGGEVKRNPASSSIHFLSRTSHPSKLRANSVISLTWKPLDLQFDSATQSNELQVLNLLWMY